MLDVATVDKNPFKQFGNWFKDAQEAQPMDANAMVVSTVGSDGRPSARVILLKDFTENGFTFYTNYNSRKAKEILENPYSTFLFFWPKLKRQVRIEGKLQMVSKEVSEEYYMTRPRGARVGAWASPQSQVVQGRQELDKLVDEATKKFEGKEVNKPEWWGGYLLTPDRFEFWEEGEWRLHDRVCYSDRKGDQWKIERLAP